MENAPSMPQMSREELVERLKARPEDLAPLNQYLDKKEAEVKNSKDALILNIEVAEIKRDAGRLEAAREAFRDAAEHAWQERDEERYQYCRAELEKLGG